MDRNKCWRQGHVQGIPPPVDLTLEERLSWLQRFWQEREYLSTYDGGSPFTTRSFYEVGEREARIFRRCIADLQRVIQGCVPWIRHEFDLIWRDKEGKDIQDYDLDERPLKDTRHP